MLPSKKRSAWRCVSKTNLAQCCSLPLAGVITRFVRMRTYGRSSCIGKVRRILPGFWCKRGRRATDGREPEHEGGGGINEPQRVVKTKRIIIYGRASTAGQQPGIARSGLTYPRLLFGGQRDRITQTQGRFQRVVIGTRQLYGVFASGSVTATKSPRH
jgi:hypothetical protein